MNRFASIYSFALLMAAFFAPVLLMAQENTGPAIGTEIREFSLRDQTGEKRSFSELLKPGPAAVVFYRSADW